MFSSLGLAPYGFFEFTGIGMILAVAGIGYMAVVGSRTIPDRRPADLAEDFGVRRFLSELSFHEGSAAWSWPRWR